MSLRNRQPVFAIPAGPLGIIGWAKFGISSTTLSNVLFGGVIASITAASANLAQVTLWPQQSFYTVAGLSLESGTNPTWFYGINAVFSPSGFQIAAAGVAPFTSPIASSLLQFVICGPTN